MAKGVSLKISGFVQGFVEVLPARLIHPARDGDLWWPRGAKVISRVRTVAIGRFTPSG